MPEKSARRGDVDAGVGCGVRGRPVSGAEFTSVDVDGVSAAVDGGAARRAELWRMRMGSARRGWEGRAWVAPMRRCAWLLHQPLAQAIVGACWCGQHPSMSIAVSGSKSGVAARD